MALSAVDHSATEITIARLELGKLDTGSPCAGWGTGLVFERQLKRMGLGRRGRPCLGLGGGERGLSVVQWSQAVS